MAAGTWTLPAAARKMLLDGTFDLDSDTFKVALVTSSSNIGSSSTTWSGVTGEVANGNGYTTGGVSVTLTLTGTTSVAVSFATNPVWTASGSGITARTAVLYETSGNVLAYVLLDSTPADVSVSSGNTLTIDSDGTPSPIFTLA
ncbi:hypothetical protein PBI_LUCKY2013_39 [Mycobacterium phage Lucky2013]|uniref:Uncharacterized protein n=4 Tax=root TaxID=1 RepID=G8I596_9CAUD|nr:hypothetical protein CM09_gp039 [Mycobacterium phage Courthouse]YP_009205169.1 hypothetical protein AVT17_gp039 [Mycobacterium phage Ariel]YP_009213256.1 hypothetical protein AVV70_gp039 [Mycobacterium phage MiaZeal]ASD50677.1 hypothetical protein PORCELAIN_38 [Mycobacterium phage Porcelain]ASD53432.1 hypothetical protein PBI_LUCKY2013_39 [Mycobacterium phage Lucky2013]ASZ74114.1 hypothetical protein SEA_SQUINT_38 [Mycobacterium phage Squint]ATN88849.1 hypothetical protein SEA_DMPSTRDIVER_